jgi:ribose transport system permease protein
MLPTQHGDIDARDASAATVPRRDRLRSPLTRRFAERYALLGAWALVIALFGILRPNTFLTSANFESILGSNAVLVVLALGLLVPLTAGDYDLSIAGNLTITSMIVAVLNVEHGVPIGVAIAAAIGAGVLIGVVNGALIAGLSLDAFIVTLGTSTLLQGLTFWISSSQTIGGISRGLVDAVVGDGVLGVPLEFYYALALCVVFWYAFEHLPLGRRLLFVGRGRSVARLSGLDVTRLRFSAFVVSGAVSAIAGVMYAGMTGAADPTSGTSFLLPAFAAAFLGATSITPGRFNPWGTFIAVYFLVTGITGLQLLGVESFVQQLFYGGALILAVALSRLTRGRRARDAT